MSQRRHLILGVFFVGVLALLTYVTLILSDFQWFGEPSDHTIHFAETNGLREGDPVLVAGMRWGKVRSLVYSPEETDITKRITVEVRLTKPVDLFANHEVRIEDSTLLGGKQLAIEPGTPDRPKIDMTVPLAGTVAPNMIQAVEEVVDENRESLRAAIAGIEAIVDNVRTGRGVLGRLVSDEELGADLSSAVANIAGTFETLNVNLAEGRGSIGALFADDGQAYNDLAAALKSARDIFETTASGQGAIGRLVSDQAVAEDVALFVEKLRTIAQSIDDTALAINAGEGVLGLLVRDQQLAEDVALIFRRLASGEGTLGRLIIEDDIYADLQGAARSLNVAFDSLNAGDGTIARLLHDDEFYQDLRIAVATLTGSLEEAREAAPISTFLNTVFLGF